MIYWRHKGHCHYQHFAILSCHIKLIDSLLPWVSTEIDQKRRQNVVKAFSETLSCALWATSFFLPHFDVICDLLLSRHVLTYNLFVKLTVCKKRQVSLPSHPYNSSLKQIAFSHVLGLTRMYRVTRGLSNKLWWTVKESLLALNIYNAIKERTLKGSNFWVTGV